MFSLREKQDIALKVEKILLSYNHPEMPEEKPMFTLHVDGKEAWSWADIKPNWTFVDNPPSISPFNELSRQLHKIKGEK